MLFLLLFFSFSIWQDPTPAYCSQHMHFTSLLPYTYYCFFVHILKTFHVSLFVQVLLSFEHSLSFSTSSMDPPLFKLLPVPVNDFVIIVCLFQLVYVLINLLGYELLCILSYNADTALPYTQMPTQIVNQKQYHVPEANSDAFKCLNIPYKIKVIHISYIHRTNYSSRGCSLS